LWNTAFPADSGLFRKFENFIRANLADKKSGEL
jgi:hypothetical protein